MRKRGGSYKTTESLLLKHSPPHDVHLVCETLIEKKKIERENGTTKRSWDIMREVLVGRAWCLFDHDLFAIVQNMEKPSI